MTVAGISLDPFRDGSSPHLPLEAHKAMIDQTQITTVKTDHRDELSMRVMEYAMAFIALAAAILLSVR